MIGDRPLDEIVPLYRDPRSEMPVTQFDYEDAEKAGPRQIRLSRPQDADRDRQGGRTAQEARHRARHPDHRFRRCGDLRDAGARRQRRRVPAGRRGHARSDAQDEARPHQRSGGAGGALPSGADGFDSQIHRLQARQGKARISPSLAGADPQRNLRRDDVSGRRDAHRPRTRRLYARPGRSAAPRDGQENRLRNGQAPRNFRHGCARAKASRNRSPSRFSSRRRNSRATASTRAMPRPMPRSPIRPPISRPIIRSNSSPRR